MTLGGKDPRQRDPDYMGWVSRLPCISCMARTGTYRLGVHVAHCRASYPEPGWREVGKGEKPHDWRTTPLCPDCHLNGPHAQHRVNETEWWAEMNIYPPALCTALQAAYHGGTSGHTVVALFAARARRAKEGDRPND